MITVDLPDEFQPFFDELVARYKEGAQQYGRTSWSKDPIALLGEIKQETVDIVGWAPFMWMALARLQEQLAKLSQLTIPEKH